MHIKLKCYIFSPNHNHVDDKRFYTSSTHVSLVKMYNDIMKVDTM